jgi:hypothetical protein
MKKLFYFSLVLWLLFEIANVYFIMPMPGSQRMNSLDLAYFLHTWRWAIRFVCVAFAVYSFRTAWQWKKWLLIPSVIILGFVGYAANFPLSADHMFLPITKKVMAKSAQNKISAERLVIGVEINGEACAYPIEMIGYHHRILDTVGGMPIFVTYCTVCRTGRVYQPLVNGKVESFRLVGMDHFNAMFEDQTTGTWWRQATGEACAGKLKGQQLPIVPNVQMTLQEWQALHPKGTVLQWDPAFTDTYKRMVKYDRGTSKSNLTGSDTGSWKEKSWVLGIDLGGLPHAYDWNVLKRRGWIADTVNNKTLFIMMHKDTMSFSAWFVPVSLPAFDGKFDLKWGYEFSNSSLSLKIDGNLQQNSSTTALKRAPVHQEFWHSWRTFHPNTIRILGGK